MIHSKSARLFFKRSAVAGWRNLTLGMVLVVVAWIGSANAMSLRELQALEKSDQQGENYADYYLVGVMEGVLEAHQHAVRNGSKPAICLRGRTLQPSMARSLFQAELRRNPGVYEADMLLALVLHNALSSVYPCHD